MQQAWAILAVSGRRQYAGNIGYEDDASRIYRFDSEVPNSSRIDSGDLVLVRDERALLGFGRIEDIVRGKGLKARLRCPSCGITGLKERRTRLPRFRCSAGHEFAEALKEEVPVTTFEAHYGSTFISAPGVITGAELRSAALRPNPQMSIEALDVFRASELLRGRVPSATRTVGMFLQDIRPDREMRKAYTPTQTDERRRALVAISERHGQSGFRKDLIRRYGPACMVTGCNIMEIVEAAHIWPYRGDADNHPENGLLLRADIHTLFDLDLLGVDPNGHIVAVSPSLLSSEYQRYADLRLSVGIHRPSCDALRLRWQAFRGPSRA